MSAESEASEPTGPQRDERGRLLPGHKLGGRPPGVPALANALKEMLTQDPKKFAEKAEAMLMEGDGRMWALILDRAWPKLPTEISGPGGAPIDFNTLVRSVPEDSDT